MLLGGLAAIAWAAGEISGATSSAPAATRYVFGAGLFLVGGYFALFGYMVTHFAVTGRKSKLVQPATWVARALIANRHLGNRPPQR